MQTPDMKKVYSSHVDAIGYSEPDGTLHVQFSNGRYGAYKGVPAQTASQVVTAASIGTALHSMVRNKYPFVYLDE